MKFRKSDSQQTKRSRFLDWPAFSGFTLIEMMAVIAVLAIAAALMIPGLSSISKGSARRAAVTRLLATLDQARAMALSRNTVCYVAFADGNQAWPEDYRWRAFALFEEVYIALPPNAPATDSPYKMLPVSGWTKLPDGFAFKPANDTVFQSPLNAATKFHSMPVGKDISTPYLKFNNLGALEEPMAAAQARVVLFEGYFTPSGEAVVTNKAGKASEDILIISPVTGRAKRQES